MYRRILCSKQEINNNERNKSNKQLLWGSKKAKKSFPKRKKITAKKKSTFCAALD